MQRETVHIHQSRLDRELNVILLLVPSLIFAAVLAVYLFTRGTSQKTQLATTTEPSILGTQDRGLDKK